MATSAGAPPRALLQKNPLIQSAHFPPGMLRTLGGQLDDILERAHALGPIFRKVFWHSIAGAAVIGTGGDTYERVVTNQSFCQHGQETKPLFSPTRDNGA